MPSKRVVEVHLPPKHYSELQEVLAAGWRLETDHEKIHARYADLDFADQVPRVLMYIDLGTLVGKIRALEAFLVHEGYLKPSPEEEEVEVQMLGPRRRC